MIPGLTWRMCKFFLYRMVQKYVIRDFHPLVLFYLSGSILFTIGLLLGTYLFVYRLAVGPVEPTSALLAIFLFITGMQSLFFAMWFDMDYNKHNRRR